MGGEEAAGTQSVLARAARGGSYLFLQRVLTFALNSFVLRRLQLSITGAVTVRLELALASVFLLRDGFRLAFLRMPSLDSADAKTHGPSTIRPLVNAAWLSTAVSWLIAVAIIVGSVLTSQPHQDAEGLEHYTLVMAMYCAAAMIEALAEPMYVLAHCSVLVSWQVSAQGAAFLVRGCVQYACIFALDLGLLAYGVAEICYASTLLAVFAGLFWRRIHDPIASKTFALDSMRQLLPHTPAVASEPWFHADLVPLLVPFSLQSGVKYLLTEGDKWVLSVFASFQNMGVYGIVFHLGSLVPRMVFLPLEEATKTIFSKIGRSSAEDKLKDKQKDLTIGEGRVVFMLLLKFIHLIGLTFACFGFNYADTLVLLLYGTEKARLGVGSALAVYCVYIYFLGVNGICEAVVHAVGNERQLMRLNKLMGVFFLIYAGSALAFMEIFQFGTIGIILANCVNMGCRIAYCLGFLANHFETARASSVFAFARQSLPDRLVVFAFGASFVVTAAAKRVLLAAPHHESWLRHCVHVVVGGVCLMLVAATLYVKERHVLRDQLALIRGKGGDSSASKPHAD